MARKINPNEKIISATLKLAATVPWQEITMDSIAKAAKVNSSILMESFSSKLLILDAFNRQLDEQITEKFSNIENVGSIREQLFEILMGRFDALNRYKSALKLIYKETVPFDPLASTHGLNNLIHSMEIVLNIVGMPTCTLFGCIKTKVLSAIFIRAFITWLEDNSADMTKTMANLDSNLAKAESLGKSVANTG